LELPPNGKAHLIPITIMIDGKFYDASAYKAAPVPMALWSETVYEAVHTGVSLGLFTVTGALQRKGSGEATEWMAEGTWQSASDIKAKAVKKPTPSIPRGMNEDEGPPVLRRAGPEKPKPVQAPAAPCLLPLSPLRLRRLHKRRRPCPQLRCPHLQLSQNRPKKTRLQRIKTGRP
jgi:hypothetical protein